MKKFSLLFQFGAFFILFPTVIKAQNVGIGELLPQAKLEIRGVNVLSNYNALLVKNISNDSLFRISNAGELIAGSKSKGYGQLQVINNGNQFSHLILKGTNDNNSGSFFTRARFADETESRYWQLRSRVYGNGSGMMNNSRNSSFSIGSDSLPDMITVDGTGKIGIAESFIPLAYLDIAVNFQAEGVPHLMLRGTGVNSQSIQAFANISGSDYWYLDSRHYAFDPASSSFNIGYNGTAKLSLRPSGNFGIGTGDPQHTLHIKTNSSHAGLVHMLLEESEEDFSRIRFQNTIANRYWEIGSFSQNLNNSSEMNFYYNNSGVILSLKGDGNATLMGNLTQLSDARLKKNITLIRDALPALMNINGYRYNWKDPEKDKTLQVGLLAQEIEKVMPELVIENNDGIKSVNYAGMIPVLIEAFKEQQLEIKALITENKRQSKMIKQLQNEILDIDLKGKVKH
ncbi:MAG: tail fiber domain-containing protein [Chitinophagaceae bacterium]|nr:tail fiber domain-containing protein [Chitinophagaceae bacterium]MBL0304892.1 tail fiber domain-containing protein [Chitinophagaceae bacterium]MBP6214577.1 tail fiber domain-containing protein [Chitinophagaceae bacterium]HQV59642.1 tail fiber domain-containing protein [Chitinophagaceae bacterium]HQV85624.1 tail fiber domain-containing protein [Chitinophagaceae bacterium]